MGDSRIVGSAPLDVLPETTRLDRGGSRTQLARRNGKTTSVIGRWERGEEDRTGAAR